MRRNKIPKSYFSFNLNIFKTLSIVLIILFIIASPNIIKRLIKITKIECSTQFGDCKRENQIGNYNVIKKQLEKELSQDIQVNSYLIQYKIPSTIKVEINIKSSKNAVYSISSAKFYLISEDGIVLSIADNSNLPTIKVENSELEVGKVIGEKQKFAIEILNHMSFLYSINEGRIEKNNLKFVTNDGINVIFPSEGDVNLLIGSARLIFSRLNDETEGIRMNEIREIDLRYKNPVLRKS